MSKILFDSDVYIRMLSEVNQQIDYEYATYGDTKEYYDLCQRYKTLEQKIALALEQEKKDKPSLVYCKWKIFFT